MDILRKYIKEFLLEISEDRIVNWAKNFKTLGDFISTIAKGGYGFKRSSHVFSIMNANTKGRLADDVSSSIAAESDWWILSDVPVSKIKNTHSSSMRKDIGNINMQAPLILGANMQIIDGRHRHLVAQQSGIKSLKAWIPAEVFYYLKVKNKDII